MPESYTVHQLIEMLSINGLEEALLVLCQEGFPAPSMYMDEVPYWDSREIKRWLKELPAADPDRIDPWELAEMLSPVKPEDVLTQLYHPQVPRWTHGDVRQPVFSGEIFLELERRLRETGAVSWPDVVDLAEAMRRHREKKGE